MHQKELDMHQEEDKHQHQQEEQGKPQKVFAEHCSRSTSGSSRQ